jgi:hypothetical protein
LQRCIAVTRRSSLLVWNGTCRSQRFARANTAHLLELAALQTELDIALLTQSLLGDGSGSDAEAKVAAAVRAAENAAALAAANAEAARTSTTTTEDRLRALQDTARQAVAGQSAQQAAAVQDGQRGTAGNSFGTALLGVALDAQDEAEIAAAEAEAAALDQAEAAAAAEADAAVLAAAVTAAEELLAAVESAGDSEGGTGVPIGGAAAIGVVGVVAGALGNRRYR